ncbi:MAG: primosomal protein N', partial [Methylobacteriaceae bacterium]|nr:primosomal protein N' [Methylobacteriaceae bacterium]
MSARHDSAVEPAETGARPTVVDVVAPVAVDTAYSYRVPAGLLLAPGDLVDVPLGTRETMGVVWAVRETQAGANLKAVHGKRDAPALHAPLMRFIDWIARWTLSPRGMVLRMAIRAADDFGPDPVRLGYRATDVAPERMTPARGRVLAVAADGFARSKSALAEAAACSAGVIDSLVDCGAL